jgi:transposase
MLRPYGEDLQVHLYRKPIDMRKGRNTLAVLVQESMGINPTCGAIFVFIGRRYDAMKLLVWERNGFAVYHKLIESEEKYHWPQLLDQEVITMTTEELSRLMDGYNVWARPHRTISFAYVG